MKAHSGKTTRKEERNEWERGPGLHPLSRSGLTGDLLAGDRGPVLSCHPSICPDHLKSTEEWLPFQLLMSFCLSEVSSSSE